MDLDVQRRFEVQGMTCAACARTIERQVKKLDGVREVLVNVATNSAVIEFDPAWQSESSINSVLQPLGYHLEAEKQDSTQPIIDRKKSLRELGRKTLLAVVLMIPLVGIAMLGDMHSSTNAWIQLALSALIMVVCGSSFYVHAYHQIRSRQLAMDSLIAISTLVAFGWSMAQLLGLQTLQHGEMHAQLYFESAGVIVALVLVGRYVEHRARYQSTLVSTELQMLQPPTALCLRDGSFKEMSLESVKSGDVVMVRQGQRIPVDGIVISGEAWVDESLLSGESTLVHKLNSSPIYAGTLNSAGTVELRVSSSGDDTLLSYIKHSVRNAQETRVEAQHLADLVSSRFIPSIFIVAVLSSALWLIFGGADAMGQAVTSFVSILIVACPCALGLAAPIALVISISRAGLRGVLIRDASALERSAKLSDVVVDKTGTLTYPDARVSRIQWQVEQTDEALDIMFTLSALSQHPRAQALHEYLAKESRTRLELKNFQETVGRGLNAECHAQKYLLGSTEFVESHLGASIEQSASLIFANSQHVICTIDVNEELRESAARLVTQLQKHNIRVHCLSGDNQEAVERVAVTLGIRDYRWSISPKQKEQYIVELQQRGAVVAMAGDGLNDAQALARADVAIAMGRGTDTAQSVSQVVLLQNGLQGIESLLTLSRKTMRIIKQNLWWAFFYNILLIPLAAGALKPWFDLQLDPMYAGAAMGVSSITVVLNSMRLQRA